MMFVQIRSLSVWNTGLIQKWKDSNDLPPVQYNHCLFQAKIMKLDLKNDDTHPNHNHIIIKSTPSNFISPTPPKQMSIKNQPRHFFCGYIFLVKKWNQGTESNLSSDFASRGMASMPGSRSERSTSRPEPPGPDWPQRRGKHPRS